MSQKTATQAYATVIVEQNHQAIVSESGSEFDMAFLKAWVEKHGPGGFFLRDETSPLDCQLFTSEQFHQLYYFEKGDVDAMFRMVRQK